VQKRLLEEANSKRNAAIQQLRATFQSAPGTYCLFLLCWKLWLGVPVVRPPTTSAFLVLHLAILTHRPCCRAVFRRTGSNRQNQPNEGSRRLPSSLLSSVALRSRIFLTGQPANTAPPFLKPRRARPKQRRRSKEETPTPSASAVTPSARPASHKAAGITARTAPAARTAARRPPERTAPARSSR